jgi:hypothetical protein
MDFGADREDLGAERGLIVVERVDEVDMRSSEKVVVNFFNGERSGKGNRGRGSNMGWI